MEQCWFIWGVLDRDHSGATKKQLASAQKHLERERKGEKKKENSQEREKKGEIGVSWQ